MGLRLLAKETPDHCPLLIDFKQPMVSHGPSPFRFQRIWCEHKSFMSCVKEAWVDCNQDVALGGLHKLVGKLKRTKVAVKVWNKQVFGRVDHIISELQERVEILEESLQEGFSDEVEQHFLVTNIELEEWQKREEIRLSKVAKKQWLRKGDNNTKFFHAVIAQQRKNRRLDQMMLENGTQLSFPRQIHMEAVTYFQNFLTEEHMGAVPNLSSLIDDTLTDEEGQYLCAMPTENEEVVEAAQDFFGGRELDRFYTSSYIVLIPKMAVLLSKIISAEQGAFIARRNIVENIALTQELVHSMNKKMQGRNVMVKVDMSKAYDRIDWPFLRYVLRTFGFLDRFCRLIDQCITKNRYSIMMNVTTQGFFKSTRGLRQGDPLSPYLFIIIQEVLTRLLKKSFDTGRIGRFSHPRGAPLVSHLICADDLVIFTNGCNKLMKGLMEVLAIYEDWSGQLINKEKSAKFFSRKCSLVQKSDIIRETGFKEGQFPML
ncbi:uncharacterized protein LOC111398286 [Olea europaea var. sylvestris]|uniref:uncharacterized protein LOC111398286 n=1 Tax=Olea europaea var. sylvestris TaxID=158386 RepID=UPI000C1D246D|nr:uncharacterized protein LOC111398286 [Olea europaea var. sylvestris]